VLGYEPPALPCPTLRDDSHRPGTREPCRGSPRERLVPRLTAAVLQECCTPSASGVLHMVDAGARMPSHTTPRSIKDRNVVFSLR
jgi:hypothetical protein